MPTTSEKPKLSSPPASVSPLTNLPMNILGISRAERFSPNSIERDAAIFAAVAERLQARGHVVTTLSEDEFAAASLGAEAAASQSAPAPFKVDAAFCMGRSEAALTRLRTFEERGTVVVNSATALLRADRDVVDAAMRSAGVPLPAVRAVDVCAPAAPRLDFEKKHTAADAPARFWLKRCDACAQEKGDVRFIASDADVLDALADFRRRGVKRAMLVEHVPGDLVKFYGVEGTPFFFVCHPTAPASAAAPSAQNFSKFGLESHNGAARGYAFSSARLKEAADAAARATGFIVYGGDAVVRADGTFAVIDFNDWPSFAACRADAADAIALRIDALAAPTL